MKRVIITGASSGIGEALALEYAKKGCSLGLVARRLERLEALKVKLEKLGTTVAIRSLDVANDQEILPTLQGIAEELGGLDLVIANAGITAIHRTGKDDFETNRRVIQVNLIAAMATVDAAANIFRQSKTKGQIVGVSSVSAFQALPGSAAYSGSKAGFSNYLSAVRMELQNKGITVTTVHPGFIATELADDMDKYPFVVSAEVAAKAMVSGIDNQKANVTVPKFPWSMLSPMAALIPEKLMSKAF